jgi:phage shock protein C
MKYRYDKFYRARDGLVFGICQGFARWRELPVGMVRLIYILLMIFTGFVPMVLVYVALAIFLPVDRSSDYRNRYYDRRNGPDDPPPNRERDWDKRFYD